MLLRLILSADRLKELMIGIRVLQGGYGGCRNQNFQELGRCRVLSGPEAVAVKRRCYSIPSILQVLLSYKTRPFWRDRSIGDAMRISHCNGHRLAKFAEIVVVVG